MTYFEKLKDPRWQKKRLEILEAANWSCEDCGGKKNTLHVHHCYYEFGRDPWEYDRDTLMALCEECHETRQEMERDAKLAFSRMLRRHSNNTTEVPNAPSDLRRLLTSCVHMCSEDYQTFIVVDALEHYIGQKIAEHVAEMTGTDAHALKIGAVPVEQVLPIK